MSSSSNDENGRKLDLGLSEIGLDDEHPRRLLRIGKHLVAYGGDECTIVEITGDNFDKVRSVERHKQDCNETAIRAVAVSDDGKRVVIGLDDGITTIYAFDEYDESANTDHPFVVSSSPCPSWAGPDWEGSCIRDLAFYPGSHMLAIASENGMVVVNAESKDAMANDKRYLQDEADKAHEQNGIRSLKFGQYQSLEKTILASLAMDGRLCLWDVSNTDSPEQWKLLEKEDMRCITKKDAGEMLGADAHDRSCRPHFMKNCPILALPGEVYLQMRSVSSGSSSAQVIQKFDMSMQDPSIETDAESASQRHTDTIVSLTSSPNKKDDHYLVSSGRDGRVMVWFTSMVKKQGELDVKANFVRQLGQYKSPPTDLLWEVNPTTGDEYLFVACADGSLFTIQGREKIAPPAILEDSSTKQASSKKTAEDTTSPSKATAHRLHKKQSTEVDSDDEDEIFGDASDKEKAEKISEKNAFIEDEADEGGDDEDDDAYFGKKDKASTPNAASPGRSASRQSHRLDDNYDDDDDDIDIERDYPALARRGGCYTSAPKLPDPQPAFAPSSTPLDLTKRFLCWNHIGSCTHLQGDVDGSPASVKIDFTDSAFRRPLSIQDNVGFILGTLGEDGAIFATDTADDDEDPAEDDDIEGLQMMSAATRAAVKRNRRTAKGSKAKPTGSTIFFHRYETFSSRRDKDWWLTLPDGERVLGCACGEGWAAAITSRRFLRTFTLGGNQGQVIWLPGEPVTMVGRNRFLAIVYHEAPPLADGTQKLGYLFYDAAACKIISQGALSCISPGSALTWVGIGNDFSFMAMDSDGMLSMLVTSSACDALQGPAIVKWEWIPVLDTMGLRKSADDSYWPVNVYDGKLVSVLLKGGTKYPDATRRPVTTLLGFRLPHARGTTAPQLEELMVRADIALNQKRAFHDIANSAGTEDEDFENEFHVLSAQVDKVVIKMFASLVNAGKLERALDLVERLHLEKSFDIVMTLADNHQKLVDLIEDAKFRKFGGPVDHDEPALTDYGDAYSGYEDDQSEQEAQRITPDSSALRKRNMADFAGGQSNLRVVKRKEASA